MTTVDVEDACVDGIYAMCGGILTTYILLEASRTGDVLDYLPWRERALERAEILPRAMIRSRLFVEARTGGGFRLFSNVPELFDIGGVDVVEIAQNVGIKTLETRFEIGFFNIVIPRVDALVQPRRRVVVRAHETDDVVHLISVSSVSTLAGLRIETRL